MALTEFSTLTTIQQRTNTQRILGWTDDVDDSTPDAATLTQGYQFASGLIFESLQKRYGETELASWTISTAPARILAISDDLCIWYFSSKNSSQNKLIEEKYQRALASLEAIREGTSALYGASEGTTDTSETVSGDDLVNPFLVDDADPVYFNE